MQFAVFLASVLLTALSAPAIGQEWGDHRPVVSPDGKLMAFMSNRSGVWAVYTMTIGDGAPQRISDHPNGEWYPDWAPDGSKLVYHRQPSEGAPSQLYVYDVNSGVERQLTRGPNENHYGRWDPSGQSIVFPSTRNGESDLYQITESGADERRILQLPGRQGEPSVSPDGRLLAYTSEISNGVTEVFVRSLHGDANVRQLTHHGAVCYGVDWSPDGSRLTYNTNADGDHEIHVLDLTSGTDEQLTHNLADDHLPRWTPDGTHLIFSSELQGPERIYVMDQTGRDRRQLDTGSR